MRGRIGGESEVSVGPCFFPDGNRVSHIPAWLLVTRTLGAPNLVRMPIRGFLQDSRASDGMVATALYFVGRVLCRPWNAFGDAGAVVPFCA